jgi:hypothetical protein
LKFPCVNGKVMMSLQERRCGRMRMSRKRDTDEREAWIGSATMEEDGTIVLRLRAEDLAGRIIGDGLLRYPVGHQMYDEILRHLGGLGKGETKRVPPWPKR